MQSAATTSAIDLEPVKDNIDNRSVCSSVCSSMKNAELIMAAFSSNQLSLTIEEENGESEKQVNQVKSHLLKLVPALLRLLKKSQMLFLVGNAQIIMLMN